jgi:hypothetical protein
MSEQDKQEANEHARRAASQAKNAAKNTGRAARAAASAGVDTAKDVGDDFYDAAKDRGSEVIDGVKEVAGDIADRPRPTGRKVGGTRPSARGLAVLTGDMGQGFIALTVALWAGSIAFQKFGAAFDARGMAMR